MNTDIEIQTIEIRWNQMDYYHYFDGIVLMRHARKIYLLKFDERPRKVNVLLRNAQ